MCINQSYPSHAPIYSNLHRINLLHVTPFLISQNPRERMLSFCVLFLVVTFPSYMSWVLTRETTLFQTKRFAKQGKQRVEPNIQQDAHEFHHRSKGHLLTLLLTSDYAFPWPFCHLQLHLVQVILYNNSLMLCLLLEFV
jgi:hypothetical protein